jgi:hypothetical protein
MNTATLGEFFVVSIDIIAHGEIDLVSIDTTVHTMFGEVLYGEHRHYYAWRDSTL